MAAPLSSRDSSKYSRFLRGGTPREARPTPQRPFCRLHFFRLITPLASSTALLHYFASRNMQRKLPETSHFFSCSFVHIQKPWQRCRAALGPFRSLRARRCQSQPAPKPSANLLPNSFCYPTTTTTQHNTGPLDPRLPGHRVPRPSVKTHRCKDTMGDFFFFLLHQPTQRRQQEEKQKSM